MYCEQTTGKLEQKVFNIMSIDVDMMGDFRTVVYSHIVRLQNRITYLKQALKMADTVKISNDIHENLKKEKLSLSRFQCLWLGIKQ